MWPIGLCIVTLVIIWVTNWIHRWRNPRCNGTLPPGTLGFPFIGETIQFFIPGHSLDLLPFFKKRVQRLVYRHPHLPLGLENILIPYDSEQNEEIGFIFFHFISSIEFLSFKNFMYVLLSLKQIWSSVPDKPSGSTGCGSS